MEREVKKIILIFKTNVIKKSDANKIVKQLKTGFPNVKANFDLDDCDKIFRVETLDTNIEKLREFILNLPFAIEELI